MKCPKCLYIGFETGDRCKNCGYDFSLLGMAEDDAAAVPSELPMRHAEPAVAGLADEAPELESRNLARALQSPYSHRIDAIRGCGSRSAAHRRAPRTTG